MKHARKALAILILFVPPMLLSGIITTIPAGEAMATITRAPTRVSIPSYETHGPIMIFNDTDFHSQASSESWEGDGSPDTPYIIEGYNITTDADSIIILDVTVSFEIQNCYLSSESGNSGSGIFIANATDASIVDVVVANKSGAMVLLIAPGIVVQNCTLTGNAHNMHVLESPGAQIDDCKIFDAGTDGLFVLNSNDTLVTNCVIDCVDGSDGIRIDVSHRVTVLNSEISNCFGSGIFVNLSPHCTIENNDIFDNTDNGVYMYGPGFTDVVVSNNRIHGNGFLDKVATMESGVFLVGYLDCIVEDNLVYNNNGTGISIQSSGTTIIGNVVYDTIGPGAGIEVVMVFDCIVSENIVYDCTAGILIYSINTNVTHNIVYDNDVGINLYSSQFCNLYGNDIGWNNQNAMQQTGMDNNMWYNNVTEIGNWWHDYSGTGVYQVSGGNHDQYPSKSLDLGQASPITFEILETENYVVWEASALNPSHYEVFVDGSSVLNETWDGETIEYLADGLSHGVHTFSIEVYHVSGHYLGNTTTADVEDLTPPHVEGPTTIQTTVGGSFNVQYTATDPSSLGTWSVNNTDFAIDSSGVLTRVGDLMAGEYVILIEISDIHGNTGSLIVHVNVVTVGLPTELVLVIGGGVIAALVVLVVVLKKTEPT